MTRNGLDIHGDTTPPLSPLLAVPSTGMGGDQSLRIPKNKSTGNLQPVKYDAPTFSQRTRFSFDAGTTQEMNNLKRVARVDHDGLGRSAFDGSDDKGRRCGRLR
ncbi:hypothetical protein CLAIMM_02512 [Cladophialophora immunda]|nr:hypothetical protein CLAIMM_02512 [Cladophialophora immunda]